MVLSEELRIAHSIVRRFLQANNCQLAREALDADLSEHLGREYPSSEDEPESTTLIPGVDPGDELTFLISKLMKQAPTLRQDVQSISYDVDLFASLPKVDIEGHSLFKSFDTLHSTNVLTGRIRPLYSNSATFPYVLATTSADRTLKFTDLVSSETLAVYHADKSPVLAIDFHPSRPDILAVAFMDGKVELLRYNLSGGPLDSVRILQTLNHHKKYVTRILFSPDGQFLATASHDKSICVYSLVEKPSKNQESSEEEGDGDEEPELYLNLIQHHHSFPGQVEAIAFNHTSSMLVAASRDDNLLYYVDLTTSSIKGDTPLNIVAIAPGSNSGVSRINMNANGDDHISFSAVDVSFRPLGSLEANGSADSSSHVLISASGTASTGRLILFRSKSGLQVRNFYGAQRSQLAPLLHAEYAMPRHAWHPSGRYIVATDDASEERGGLVVFDVETEKVVARLQGVHRKDVRSMQFVSFPKNGEEDESAESSLNLGPLALVTVSFDSVNVWKFPV